MDPFTQGVVGAVAAQQRAHKTQWLLPTLLGLASGMAPDLDIFIRSSSDPLLALEFHRQFTHSLLFIPIGGLLCASFFYGLLAKRSGLTFGQTYLFCTLGYATHGLIDASTTYGTQLFWPFSDARIAWHIISIIDPLFTLPLLALVILACVKRRRLFALFALLWCLGYLALGVVQRERAEAVGWQLAASRGDPAIRVEAKPSLANILLWKLVTTTETGYRVDAVHLGLDTQIYEGDQVPVLVIDRDLPWLDPHSQQARDIERFRWFSNGYIALSPRHPYQIIDVRYSFLPHQINALWAIELDPHADPAAHVRYEHNRARDERTWGQLWRMVKGGVITGQIR